jgi:hypothetical protein
MEGERGFWFARRKPRVIAGRNALFEPAVGQKHVVRYANTRFGWPSLSGEEVADEHGVAATAFS